ncbi:MAG: hypothetical protein Q9225_003105 [Loekoesia sp. 1 TL-2023]
MSGLAEAAPALLGSTLLANEEKHESTKPASASAGNRLIDEEVLDGGFRYGEITSIAGAIGTGKTTLAYQAMASHLIAHEKGEVTLIATTDPPLSRLKDALTSRLAHDHRGPEYQESGYVYSKQYSPVRPAQEVSNSVLSMLGRVRISRVFDFPGVADAVAEFSARLVDSDQRDEARANGEEVMMTRSIADSEDEAEGELLREGDGRRHEMTNDVRNEKLVLEHSPASMIIIDNIANVAGSMMTKSQDMQY